MMIELTTPKTTVYFDNYKDLADNLSKRLCWYCAREITHCYTSEDIMSYSDEEWVQELLMTLCGAEWFVEEV